MKVAFKNSNNEFHSFRNYRKLLWGSILLTSLVAIAPLIFFAILNYIQYRKTYETDVVNHLVRQVSIKKKGSKHLLTKEFLY